LTIRRRVKDALARTLRMTATDLWPLVQATAAVSVAWLIAHDLIDHPDPFFAPVAALVSLNASFGERGLNALRLLQGVILGIVVGELALLALGGGYGALSLGTFVALVLARAFGNARIVLSQAGISAILTISVANGDLGYQRITDALIGTGVALVFTQLIFSPQPLRLLHRVEADALTAMANALDLAAQGLSGDDLLGERAIASQRQLRDRLSELARVRHASARVARHSLVWRGQIKPMVRESEDAGHLDLLGGSCLLLTRTSLGTDEEDRLLLAPCVSALATTLADLAREPGDRDRRQHAVDGSLEILRTMRAVRAKPNPELTAALVAARIAVIDLMDFVGVDPDDARLATREESRHRAEPDVRETPSVREPPHRLPQRWWDDVRERRSGGSRVRESQDPAETRRADGA
jgi:hypothetical protein